MELQKIETHRSFGGQQIKYRHLSETLHCEMTFSVYLPETTVENQEIPLIWWLAGLTSTDDNFSIKGDSNAMQQNSKSPSSCRTHRLGELLLTVKIGISVKGLAFT